ncbi:MAG: J domain-containing protein [Planctomycetes bacterium]|nr:J domain-containing protein [Planctomycetota bacterium]
MAAEDCFAILGLTPGRYDSREIARRYRVQRERWLRVMDDPARYSESRQQLNRLHVAYNTLRDPQAQQEYLLRRDRDDDVVNMRRLISASLEGGLLRYSRRQEILDVARRLGFSDFQTQLLIAQVQFGEDQITPMGRARRSSGAGSSRAWARLAAAGLMALALFIFMVRWLDG